MNCKQFETGVADLARGELLEASARADALRHTKNCAACAARLADEEALSSAFRIVTIADARQSAPSHIETALLSALRERKFAAPPPSPVRAASLWERFSSSHALFAAGAAAVVAALVLVVFAAARFELQRGSNAVAKQATSNNAGPVSAPLPAPAVIDAIPRKIEVSSAAIKRLPRANSSNSRTRPASRELQPPLRFVETMTVPGESAAQQSGGAGGETNEGESLTDFVSLNSDGRTTPVESGQLVRVQLNRASLASLGLPINVERAGETVKADVLLSEDGIARAIRFVR